ncbi:MAG: class 1 isoprenoid biosynthesis enzyme [Spirochaetes bacterium]|nr:class 1 isoprenoid biosynthesis enzyme [Spirochaetota bacterium]
MTDPILRACSTVSFGPIDIGDAAGFYRPIDIGDAAGFYRRLNSHMTALCRSLPETMQTKAMMFLMEYGRIAVGESLDFFKHYYAPSWSALYWTVAAPGACGAISEQDLDDALRCQAMAMSLHSFDDHLVEGGVAASHLTLLVRSQAWRFMKDAIGRFCDGLPGGSAIAAGLINDYYCAITEGEASKDLDGYCDLFRKQMATWVVMPVLCARKSGKGEEFITALRGSYESFGIAWRLLDDIQDLEDDMADGAHSAVYVCLDDRGHALWNEKGQDTGKGAEKRSERICAMVSEGKIIESIAGRIVAELDKAAALADGIGLRGLGDEYRVLAGPVREWVDRNR